MDLIKSENAPKAIGPYSQAVRGNGLLFCSGQIPMTVSGEILKGGIKAQTKQVMENLKAILFAAGTDFERIVKTTIYLTDIDDFEAMNEVYASYFGEEHKPARATVAVHGLPKGVKVEIDCIAED